MLEIDDLHVGFGKVEVIRGTSLAARPGEVVGIIGPNGAGKSTILNTVAGLNSVWAGKISVNGTDVTGRSPAAVIAAGAALIPQGRRLFGSLTVRQNIELGAYATRDRSVRSDRFDHVLTYFPEIAKRLNVPARSLSGGQQQLVSVARGLMSGASVILLDEPSMGVSPALIHRLSETIRELVERLSLTVVLVEQNMDLALSASDRIVVLVQGCQVHETVPGALRDDSSILATLYFGER
jgi:branched-chain amino acid transport system ATP-binding protein